MILSVAQQYCNQLQPLLLPLHAAQHELQAGREVQSVEQAALSAQYTLSVGRLVLSHHANSAVDDNERAADLCCADQTALWHEDR
jgi:hypothetical protein